MQIKLILADFDGTLFDTQKANFLAYQEVLKELGYTLTPGEYDAVFGLRLKEFMKRIGITDPATVEQIRQQKKKVYPRYFEYIRCNRILLDFMVKFRASGCKTGLVSTAQRHNMINILEYFNIMNLFDSIVSGNEVAKAKPDPFAYLHAMKKLNVTPGETLIFEDSETGIEAANRANAAYIVINHVFF